MFLILTLTTRHFPPTLPPPLLPLFASPSVVAVVVAFLSSPQVPRQVETTPASLDRPDQTSLTRNSSIIQTTVTAGLVVLCTTFVFFTCLRNFLIVSIFCSSRCSHFRETRHGLD